MVFFIANCWRILATDAGLARTRSRSRSRPLKISGSWWRSRPSASGAPVSTTVPDGSTTTIESSVR